MASDSFTNVFANVVAPVSRSMDSAVGFGIDIFLESSISYLIRWLTNMTVPFFTIMAQVALAAPLLGIGGNFEVDNRGEKAKLWSVRFLQGLQTTPSLFFGQYIYGIVANGGFYNPGFSIWHILVTTIARTLSRVIILFLRDSGLPGMGKWDAYMVLQQNQIKGGKWT